MPDTIIDVEFRSDGAAKSAPLGEYPIYPSRVTINPANSRLRYSFRYEPGTMLVVGGIGFVRRAHTELANWNSGPGFPSLGTQSYNLPVAPEVNHLLVVVLTINFLDNPDDGVTPMATAAAVANGSGLAYSRVGGSGYLAFATEDSPAVGFFAHERYRTSISMWYKVTNGGSLSDDATVQFDVAADDLAVNGLNFQVEVDVLEYSGANLGSPLTDQTKAEQDASQSDGTDGVSNFPTTNLNLNGTTGQMVVAVYSDRFWSRRGSGDYLIAPKANKPSGYIQRSDNTFANGDAINGSLIFDRTGLSGIGPVNPTIALLANSGYSFDPTLPKYAYCAMAAAFTKL